MSVCYLAIFFADFLILDNTEYQFQHHVFSPPKKSILDLVLIILDQSYVILNLLFYFYNSSTPCGILKLNKFAFKGAFKIIFENLKIVV
ncbi:MAG: hypothetical protein ACD_29C00375G0001 [uncultured bacterium]|nr:MAG: hypothetical protein ACD_29C00375G0001 [uncultured bacterium]